VDTIVVGVDGSEESKTALRWAVEEAELRGARLRVVYAYDLKVAWRQFTYAEEMTQEQMAGIQRKMQQEAEEARRHAEGLVQGLVHEIAGRDAKIETVVLQAHHPADALVEQSENAKMLVVGSRGRGGFTGLVLGSVSQQCLHHAKCPVLVIRPQD
jgi:nucleotide-binding universal stress UspA family protein